MGFIEEFIPQGGAAGYRFRAQLRRVPWEGFTEESSEFIRSLNCWNSASIVSDIVAPLGIRIDAGLTGLSLILIS
jgi:hypothetical protein